MHWTVAGAGNILCADDGFGIRVVQALAQKELPPSVELLELGVEPLALRPALEQRDKLIIVDTLAVGNKPGKLYIARLADVYPLRGFSSLHDLSYWHTLPEFPSVQGWIVGVEPKTVECFRLGLSLPVAAQVLPAAEVVLGLITEVDKLIST